MDPNLPETKKIKIDKIGLERINKRLQDEGMNLLPANTAEEIGAEQESVESPNQTNKT